MEITPKLCKIHQIRRCTICPPERKPRIGDKIRCLFEEKNFIEPGVEGIIVNVPARTNNESVRVLWKNDCVCFIKFGQFEWVEPEDEEESA